MPHRPVFLSYASEDRSAATRIHIELEARGLDVWFDMRDLGIGSWREAITTAITNSRYFVFCVSGTALEKISRGRGYQDQELAEAYYIATRQDRSGFNIVPLRLADVGHGDHRLAIHNQFDLFDDWSGSLDRVAVLMGGRALAATAPLVNPEAEAHFASGVGYALTGEVEKALAELEKATSLDPKHADAWTQRAMILHAQGEYPQALDLYDQALYIKPTSDIARHNLGTLRAAMGDHNSALKEIDRALEIRPSAAVYHLSRGAVLAKLDRCDDAEAAFCQAVALADDEVAMTLDAYAHLCYCSYAKGLDLLERALADHPTRAELWYQKLKHPSVFSNEEASREVLRELTRLIPESSFFWSLFAEKLAQPPSPEIDEAIAAHDRAVEHAPDRRSRQEELLHKGNTLWWLALISKEPTLFEEAIDAYDEVCELDEDSKLTHEAIHHTALALHRLGRTQDAQETARRVEALGWTVDFEGILMTGRSRVLP